MGLLDKWKEIKCELKKLEGVESLYTEEQILETKKLFDEAVSRFNRTDKFELLIVPYYGTDDYQYLSYLFRNNLIADKYLKKLCIENNMGYGIFVELEGDYPTLVFFREEKKKLQKKNRN